MSERRKDEPEEPHQGRRTLPSVDAVLRSAAGRAGAAAHGRATLARHVRAVLAEARAGGAVGSDAIAAEAIAAGAAARAVRAARPSQRPVLNLTGTVLHTNLGRAVLAEAAQAAALAAMSGATNLEYDLDEGRRGERDSHVRPLLVELTGAESSIAVNNNAAAVILALNTLARGKETILSRGELVEIGGSFRMPDIMERAGTRLVEVGTTNRTHKADYERAVGPETALLMKVHTSNFRVEGFTAVVPAREVAAIARAASRPFIDDLGSGALVDGGDLGLPRERTVAEALADGADLVTFSGDKLLGGPQAGLIVGRRDLIERLARNPLRRALRLDRMRLAALEATLALYRDPDTLADRLPTLRWLARPAGEVRRLAGQLCGPVAARLGPHWKVELAECTSEAGSGALPLAAIPSAALAISGAGVAGGRDVEALARRLRRLDTPVIGRIAAGRLLLDLRCLDDGEALLDALGSLGASP